MTRHSVNLLEILAPWASHFERHFTTHRLSSLWPI
jgi:hypothetical protein